MSRLGRIARRSFLIGTAAVAGGAAFGVWALRQPVENPFADEAGALNPFVVVDAGGVRIVTPRAEMGQGIHTTLAALVAEELDLAWEQVQVLHGPPARAYYNSALLRLAGATAREALKEAAAQRLGVPRDRLGTEDGHVTAPDGSRIPYADLAEAAAAVDPPEVTLRPASAWRFLGRSLPRVDMVAKATGTAHYALDIRLPGMRFATVRMTPHPGGGMAAMDPEPALALPGVDRVIDLGTGFAVVARTTWEALQGAEAVAVDWTPGPIPETTAQMFEAIRAAFGTRRNSRARNDGDTDRALGGASEIVTAEYRVPFLHHATMEPPGAAALFETEGPRLTLWSGNQAPILHRDKAAEAAGLAPDQVTLHTPMMGGGFGRRAETDFTVLAARVAAAMPDTPVMVTWSREEDFARGFYRPAAIARMQGAVSGGRVTAFEAKVAAPSVTRQAARRMAGFAPPGPDRGHLEGMADQPYGFPSYRVEGYLADLAVPVGFWRAVGTSFNGFFHESFVDELAHAAGADPLAFRLAHLTDPASRGVLEAVAEMSGWTGASPQGTGRGVAFTRSFGTPVAQVVELVDEDGRIRIARAWIACDPGLALDPAIIRQQMEGGLIFGLSAAALEEITFAEGRVEQRNFPDHDALRITGAPRVEVRILQSGRHMGGVGEPATPPAMAALANAVFDLTGERIRELPLSRRLRFVV